MKRHEILSSWLQDSLSQMVLSEHTMGYLFSRGASQERMGELRLTEWCEPSTLCKDENFYKKFGSKGQSLSGHIIFPLYAPTGLFLGFEARDPNSKYLRDFIVHPLSEWHPVFFGMSSQTMEKIWEGAKVWIVEGPFDLFALDWALSGSNVVLSTIKAGLSKNHLRFLERFAKEVVMVYDNDKTGRKATQNALWELKNRKVNVTAYQYRGGDPGEVWDQGGEYNIKQEFKMGLFDG